MAIAITVIAAEEPKHELGAVTINPVPVTQSPSLLSLVLMDLPMRILLQDGMVGGVAQGEISVEGKWNRDGGHDKGTEDAEEGALDDGLPGNEKEDGNEKEEGEWEDEDDEEPPELRKAALTAVEPVIEEMDLDVILEESRRTCDAPPVTEPTAGFSTFWEVMQYERKKKQEEARVEKQREERERRAEIRNQVKMQREPEEEEKQKPEGQQKAPQTKKGVKQGKVKQQPNKKLTKRERKARKKEKREMAKLNGGKKVNGGKKTNGGKMTKGQRREVEMARLRECERELIRLRAERSAGRMRIVDPPLRPLPPPPPGDREQRVGISAVLERVWESQTLKQGVSNPETIISGSLIGNGSVNEEGRQRLTAPERPTGKEEPGELTVGGFYSRVGNKSNEFQFEMVVDLKGLGKRKRLDDGELEDPKNLTEEDMEIPTITKVAISLESSAEYRIVVSGERPEKRSRAEEMIEM